METINTIPHLRQVVTHWQQKGFTIAFVPTMGNLHLGHLKLVEIARTKADKVVVSIFVNPTQFGINEDFEKELRKSNVSKINSATSRLAIL